MLFSPQDAMQENMGNNVLKLLKRCGEGVIVYPTSKIAHPDSVEIGDYTRICDFVFIHPAGGNIQIGRYCDFEPMSQIWGTGNLIIGDFVDFGPGVTIMSQGYDYKTCGIMVGTVEQQHSKTIYTDLTIGDHVYFGANSTVLHTVKNIGEGALIGANTLVNKDLDPWGVYVGSPARKIGERPKIALDQVKEYGI